MQWDQCRRFYNFLMADNMKRIILSHRCSASLLPRELAPLSAYFRVTKSQNSSFFGGEKKKKGRGGTNSQLTAL